MNYGNYISIFNYKKKKRIVFLFFSRAGVPEKYCADIERKVHGTIHANTQTTTDTPTVH